jgi:hypothetical protein
MFPEVFQKPRDEYLYAILRKLVEDEGMSLTSSIEDQPPVEVIDFYIGNLHVSPLSRLWNTQSRHSVVITDEPRRKVDNDE